MKKLFYFLSCLFCVASLYSCKVGDAIVVSHTDTLYVTKTDTFVMYKDKYIHDSIVEVLYIDRNTRDTIFRDRIRYRDVRDTVFIASNSVSDSIQTNTSVIVEKPSEPKKQGKFARFVGRIVLSGVLLFVLFLFGKLAIEFWRHGR